MIKSLPESTTNNENTHDLTDVFGHMVETASLLGSAIYKIQEAWTGGMSCSMPTILLSSIPLRVPKGSGVNGHTPS